MQRMRPQTAVEIAADALEVPADGRIAFVEERVADDAALR